MNVNFTVSIEIEPSNYTDLLTIQDAIANAIERQRQEGNLTSYDDTETLIGEISVTLED